MLTMLSTVIKRSVTRRVTIWPIASGWTTRVGTKLLRSPRLNHGAWTDTAGRTKSSGKHVCNVWYLSVLLLILVRWIVNETWNGGLVIFLCLWMHSRIYQADSSLHVFELFAYIAPCCGRKGVLEYFRRPLSSPDRRMYSGNNTHTSSCVSAVATLRHVC